MNPDIEVQPVPQASPDGPLPLLSLVIITHKRHTLFWKAYHSALAARAHYDAEVELIIVTSDTAQIFDELAPGVREVHAPKARYAGEKRNVGLRHAASQWIIFMDDDCEIAPDGFNVIAHHVAAYPPDTGGFIGITEFAGDKGYWFKVLEGTDFMEDFKWAGYQDSLHWGTCTLATFRRSALIEVGGFDARFTVGGEDVAVCTDLRFHGHQIRGIPKTLVYHTTQTWNSFRSNLRRFYNYGLGEAQLQLRFPEYTYPDPEALLFYALFYVVLMGSLLGLTDGTVGNMATITLIYILSVAVAEYVAEFWYSRKSLLQTFGLLLFRLAYRMGARKLSFRNLLKRLNWEALKQGTPVTPTYFGSSFFLKWGIVLTGTGLALLLILP